MTKSAWKLVLLVGLFFVGGYFLLPGPGAKDAGYSLIGFASVAAIVVGARHHRPAERASWFAVAGGNLCFVVGDGVYDVYQFLLHKPTPFPSVADAFYLGGYPLLIVGVVGLTRRPGHTRESRDSYVDAGIITFGALALSWHFLMASYVHASGTGVFATLVTFAYPVMDLGVLYIVVSGLVFGRSRRPTLGILLAAMSSMIVADFAYDLLSIHGSYQVGNPVDAGWLLNYVLVAVAALYPAMAAERAPVSEERDETGARLPVVVAAGFVSPVILLVTNLAGTVSDVAAQASISMILFALVVLRTRWAVVRIASQARSLADALATKGALETELRHQAFHDSLTSLPNRALLHDRLDHALAAMPRAGGAVALCYCDLDGFKSINDRRGHLAGDTLLIAISKRLVAAVRPGDTVARIGGDEFAVLMEGIESPAEAVAVAERIVSVLREPMTFQDQQMGVSVSVGVAVAGTCASTEGLLSQADSAMYDAKASGKGRVEVFEAHGGRSGDRTSRLSFCHLEGTT